MEIRSFTHRGCAVSMDAVNKEGDGESLHVEVAKSIEEVATGQRLFAENLRVQRSSEPKHPSEMAMRTDSLGAEN
ncbi:hypothetical protein B0G84_8520 [Paraburkholderia sp. BL8N3]|nr:hypothetical protein [Paraburkholderia sp. BL8N3]TCK32680.1 hypothetical protein B0G84_8520 [Paraburkholderia sp. BL8N3]